MERGQYPGPNRNNSGTQNNWRITADVAFGSFTSLRACSSHFRFGLETGHIVALRRMVERAKVRSINKPSESSLWWVPSVRFYPLAPAAEPGLGAAHDLVEHDGHGCQHGDQAEQFLSDRNSR